MAQDELSQISVALQAINAASVKIPPFSSMAFDPELWFVRVEATFATGHVTNEETRLQHILQHLDQRHLELMAWRIKNPSPDQPYTIFKREFLSKTTKPKSAGLRECLSCQLGDRTPSELLSFMERMWPDQRAACESEAFQELFFMKLPPTIQERISQSCGSLRDKAVVADGELARIRQAKLDASVGNNAIIGSIGSHTFEPEEVTEAKAILAAYQKGQPLTSVTKKAKGVRQASGGYLQDNGQILCWYHARYDQQARQCRKYCARYVSKSQEKKSSMGNEWSARQ